MSKRLQDNLNSNYVAMANRLRPKKACRKIVAYVESYDDIFFWRSVLQKHETDKVKFQVMLPSRTTLGRGKKTALTNALGPRLGEYMIACVDSDYDWLMQGCTDMSRVICNNPYILHTYTYAIENYQCYAPSLQMVCVMSTLNDRVVMDIEAFVTEYSRIIWPLFIWNVWAYRYGWFKQFSMSQFMDVVALRDVNPYYPEKSIAYLRNRVNKCIARLQRTFPQAKPVFPRLRDELLRMGLTPETTYLYVHGHSLFESVIMPLMTPICNVLRKEREREIRELAGHEQQRSNELSCYQHSQSPIDMMLRKSVGFMDSPPFQLLKADILRLMKRVEGSPAQ